MVLALAVGRRVAGGRGGGAGDTVGGGAGGSGGGAGGGRVCSVLVLWVSVTVSWAGKS